MQKRCLRTHARSPWESSAIVHVQDEEVNIKGCQLVALYAVSLQQTIETFMHQFSNAQREQTHLMRGSDLLPCVARKHGVKCTCLAAGLIHLAWHLPHGICTTNSPLRIMWLMLRATFIIHSPMQCDGGKQGTSTDKFVDTCNTLPAPNTDSDHL